MDDLKIFKHEQFGEIRTIEINKEPWFVGKDVAEILGYSEPRSAVSKRVDPEDRGVAEMETPSGRQQMTIINESGLYSLVLSSKLPTAKEFKRWVTNEVLPSIRKHGAYMTPETIEKAIMNPDFLINLATELKKEQEKNRELQAENKEMQPKALFADSVASSHTSILVGELAKLLKQNGVDMGQNRLFKWLRDNGYLMKTKNIPTQASMERGLFEIKESVVNNPDGSTRITQTTKVTGKGQVYFVNKFLGGAV